MIKKIIILMMILTILNGCSKNNVEYETYDYEHNEVIFNFEYPKDWIVEPIAVWDATENETDPTKIREASPERGGVDIYKEKDSNNSIGVYYVVSNWSFPTSENIEQSELFSGKQKIADISTIKQLGKVIMLVSYESSGGYIASVSVTDEFYNTNEEIIWHILKSVEY